MVVEGRTEWVVEAQNALVKVAKVRHVLLPVAMTTVAAVLAVDDVIEEVKVVIGGYEKVVIVIGAAPFVGHVLRLLAVGEEETGETLGTVVVVEVGMCALKV